MQVISVVLALNEIVKSANVGNFGLTLSKPIIISTEFKKKISQDQIVCV